MLNNGIAEHKKIEFIKMIKRQSAYTKTSVILTVCLLEQ